MKLTIHNVHTLEAIPCPACWQVSPNGRLYDLTIIHKMSDGVGRLPEVYLWTYVPNEIMGSLFSGSVDYVHLAALSDLGPESMIYGRAAQYMLLGVRLRDGTDLNGIPIAWRRIRNRRMLGGVVLTLSSIFLLSRSTTFALNVVGAVALAVAFQCFRQWLRLRIKPWQAMGFYGSRNNAPFEIWRADVDSGSERQPNISRDTTRPESLADGTAETARPSCMRYQPAFMASGTGSQPRRSPTPLRAALPAPEHAGDFPGS